MKRVLSVFMSLLLALSASTTVFAEETPYYYNGESVITTRVYSTCTISIPEIIDTSNPTTWNIEVSDANVAVGENIKVKITNLNENNAISLTRPNSDTTFDVQFTMQDGTEVTRNSPYIAKITNISSEGTATASFGVLLQGDSSRAKAGIYEGRMQYEVIINEYWD